MPSGRHHTMLSPGTKYPSPSGPGYPPWSSKRKKNHPHLTTCMAQTKSSSALPLYLCTPNREIFFPVKVFKSKCYKHFMLIHTAFPVNIYIAKLFSFSLFSHYSFSLFLKWNFKWEIFSPLSNLSPIFPSKNFCNQNLTNLLMFLKFFVRRVAILLL